MIFNISQPLTILADGCTILPQVSDRGTRPNVKKIADYAKEHDLTLKAAAMELGFVTEAEFDRLVDPAKMVGPSPAKLET
jgi:fumarate hydratase class II